MIEQITISILQNLYRRARDLARHRNRSVDDVMVELLDDILPPDENGEVDDEEETTVKREMQAYITLHPTLKEKYLGQHVAIYGGKLIDTDPNYGALYQRIDAQYPDQFVWLATVEEEAMPTLTFLSCHTLN